jgi:hypothetical protein
VTKFPGKAIMRIARRNDEEIMRGGPAKIGAMASSWSSAIRGYESRWGRCLIVAVGG